MSSSSFFCLYVSFLCCSVVVVHCQGNLGFHLEMHEMKELFFKEIKGHYLEVWRQWLYTMLKNKKNYIRLSFVSRTDNALPFHVCLVEINIMIMTLCTTIKKFLLGNYNCKLYSVFALYRYFLVFSNTISADSFKSSIESLYLIRL